MKPTHLHTQTQGNLPDLLNRSRILALLVLILTLCSNAMLQAGNVYWTNTANASWSTAANWSPNTVPTNTDNAILGEGDSSNAYIDLAGTNGVGVGSITLSPNRTQGNVVLRQSDGKIDPIYVYGLSGILITNASTVKRLQISQSGVTAPVLYLAGDGVIGVPGTMEMLFYTGIKEANGSHGFTKTGSGKITFQTPAGNTHTGPTTISEGTIDLRLSTSALGTNTIYLSGGTLLCAADRSTVAPTVSPVVITANSVIRGNGTSTTAPRVFPFSGSFSGSAGTLTIDNIGNAGNTFIVRLIGGGFNFTRPIMLNSDTSTYGAYTVLQLSNAPANGTQTFSGVINSYDYSGKVERMGAPGTTVFTGDNTYQGGTLISCGTLLANNTTGSALGSGTATVTNLGVLGGSGTVTSATVTRGGTISPGASSTNLANLTVTSLTFGEGATYLWQVGAATGTAGVNWDLITVDSWSDLASSANPVTIKVDSQGVIPTGWNAGTARDWVILQPGNNYGFNASDFALDTTAFIGNVQGIFALYADSNGAIHLSYTPAADIVINVPTGTQSQSDAGYATLTGAQGVAKIGNGELVVDNPMNDYQGSTKVLAGTLSISVDAANGSGALGNSSTAAYVGDTTGNSNATFNINVSGVTMSHDLVVQAGSSGTKTIGTTITSGSVSYLGGITLLDSAVLSAASGSSILFAGDFSGSGGVALNGPGSFTLSGIGSYSGTTTLNTPVLALNGPAFGTNTLTVATAMTLDNTSGADITLNSCPQVWNADFEFVGTSGLNLGGGTVTINTNRAVTVDAGILTIGGPITGNGSLTKRGDGALSLKGSASSYKGGTTNLAGVLVVNGTASFGDGTGTLLLAGGNLLCTATHISSPLANPVVMTADTVITCTNDTGPTYLAFSGTFSAPGGNKLTIANKGWNTTVSGVRFQGPVNIDWPIVVGDPAYDRPAGGVTNQLQFYSTTNTAAQVVSGVISGPGWVVRGNNTANSGGTTILTAVNTFSGPMNLIGGALGFGCSSVSASGAIVGGPIGTNTFIIGNQTTAETNMSVFAYGGSRIIENPIFLNGAQNVNMIGTNDLAFTGAIAAGGIAKTWTVRDSGVLTLAGQITCNTGSDGAPLTKAGPGTLVLSADNLYFGATTVAAGTLLARNTSGSATGTNTVYVRSGATLGGTGTVAGRVSVSSGGNVAPGGSVGTLTVGGGVNLSSGGIYVWDLAANTTNNPGTGFDVLSVTGGSVVLGGSSQLSINFTGTATAPDAANPFWQTNHSWTILAVSGSASNPGSTVFASVANGTNSAGSFSTSADASGNVVLTFTPGSVLPPPQPRLSQTIQGIGTPNLTLSWSTESGYVYQLQYKTNLNQTGWLVVGNVTATGATASLTHTNVTWPQCYYRVIVP